MSNNYKIVPIFLACSVFLSSSYVYAKEFPKQDNVEINKSWTIKFNSILDTKSLDKNINITDSKGNVFETIINISDDKKNVTLTPKKPYIPYETYTLNVSSNVRSIKDKTLGENSTKKFIVYDHNINIENEKIIREFRSHHGYTDDELQNLEIKYLGNVEGYFIYYVPLKKSVDWDNGVNYTAKGCVFPSLSMARIIGIKDKNLYTLGEMIFETSLKNHPEDIYNLLLDEFKDLKKIGLED